MRRIKLNEFNNIIDNIVQYVKRPITCHSPQFIILPSIQDPTLEEILPEGIYFFSGPFNSIPSQGGLDFPNDNIIVTFDPKAPVVPTYSFNVTLYFASIYPNTTTYNIYTTNFTLNLNNNFTSISKFYYPAYPIPFFQGPFLPTPTQGVTPDASGYQSLAWPNDIVISQNPFSPISNVYIQNTYFYSNTPNINGSVILAGYDFFPAPSFYSGPFYTLPIQGTLYFPNNITEQIDPILPYIYSVKNTIYYLITLPGVLPPTTASGSVIPVLNIAYYIVYNTQIINYQLSGNSIWGTGPMNLNYYIGDNYSPETSSTAEINYINLVPNSDPNQLDISDASGGFILNPRGYLITNYYPSKVFYFHYLAALFRIEDDNLDTGYRYYLELQPIPSLNKCNVEKLQFFSYITSPYSIGEGGDILDNVEVDSEVENTLPLDNAFSYKPHKGYRLALWGDQGPNPWSRRSASTFFNSTPQELINYNLAEEQLIYAESTGNTTLISEAQALVNSTYSLLQNLYPRIEVWPSFTNPISLNAWVGIQPSKIKTVYYVCKYSVNKNRTTNLLEITSNSYTKPIGAPVYYKHYNKNENVYLWDGEAGNSNISLHEVVNPLVEEGNNNTKGTSGYLRFIPIISNSVYDTNGQLTCQLIDKCVTIGDNGFVMTFDLEKLIGINNNFGNIMYIRRLNPSPYYLNLKDGAFFNLPYLLNDYKNVSDIIYDYIDETKGPYWDNNYVYYYKGSNLVVPQGFTLTGLDHSKQSNTFSFSTHHRKMRKYDTNTLILKIDFEC